jgi:hypothetical protein
MDYEKFWSWICGRNMLGRMRRENKIFGSMNVFTTNYCTGDCEEAIRKHTTEMDIAEHEMIEMLNWLTYKLFLQ